MTDQEKVIEKAASKLARNTQNKLNDFDRLQNLYEELRELGLLHHCLPVLQTSYQHSFPASYWMESVMNRIKNGEINVK